ncbi:hypothetical protein GWI33_016033 [Rhynchophorus ferrugineus]|uniref:Uncharacterized protein n=1 Tax=Rhynchophorus ferrugineus TaxID=354439 RepID=A0A834I2Q9_RHYFE|nr:hypothetical protein GWI33_016033 [Rhynchophorus ferrugineus]
MADEKGGNNRKRGCQRTSNLTFFFETSAVPHGAAYVMNYLVNGNMYRRRLDTLGQKTQYLRDIRLSGNAYVLKGLENIPDN